MRLSIDAEAEALYLRLREGKVGSSKEVWDGVILDLDEAGEVLGVEILWLSRRMPLEATGTLNLELPLAGAR